MAESALSAHILASPDGAAAAAGPVSAPLPAASADAAGVPVDYISSLTRLFQMYWMPSKLSQNCFLRILCKAKNLLRNLHFSR